MTERKRNIYSVNWSMSVGTGTYVVVWDNIILVVVKKLKMLALDSCP